MNKLAEFAVAMRGITKKFPGVTALDGVTLQVRRGEVHAICGENGAGKSTLMKILSGVYQPDAGELEVAGQSVQFHSTRDAEKAGVAIIHQELELVEELSVSANVFTDILPTVVEDLIKDMGESKDNITSLWIEPNYSKTFFRLEFKNGKYIDKTIKFNRDNTEWEYLVK